MGDERQPRSTEAGVPIDPATRSQMDALFRRDTLARLLGVELVDWAPGRARLRWVGPGALQLRGRRSRWGPVQPG